MEPGLSIDLGGTRSFNRIATAVVPYRGGWRIRLRFSHTDHTEIRTELSRRVFANRREAEDTAVRLAYQLRERLS